MFSNDFSLNFKKNRFIFYELNLDISNSVKYYNDGSICYSFLKHFLIRFFIFFLSYLLLLNFLSSKFLINFKNKKSLILKIIEAKTIKINKFPMIKKQ